MVYARHSEREFPKYEDETRYSELDYNSYTTRRPRYNSKYSQDDQHHEYQEYNHNHQPYNSYRNFRSYGSRLEYNQEEPSYPAYQSYSPAYRYPDSPPAQYGTEEKPELSVIENLKKHLPWPLSMVGRLGEEEAGSGYPDSIQSILGVIDPREQSNTDYTNHQVLPFLDVEYDDNSLGFSSREDNY